MGDTFYGLEGVLYNFFIFKYYRSSCLEEYKCTKIKIKVVARENVHQVSINYETNYFVRSLEKRKPARKNWSSLKVAV